MRQEIHYQELSDEKLIELYKNGDQSVVNFLCEKYKPLVKKMTNDYFLKGGESEDLIQEGMIGLFNAIGSFDPERGVTFFSFAESCVGNQIHNAIAASSRKKHSPLNSYISIYDEDDENGPQVADPAELIIEEEHRAGLMEKLRETLSPMEKKVLDLYLLGLNYHEIASALDKEDKSIDNTLTRIRSKAKKL